MFMFLVPFIRISDKSPGLQQIWLFLERNGTNLIECEHAHTTVEGAIQYAKEFTTINGLTLDAEPYCLDNIIFCPVKKDSPELNNFYTWKETPIGTTPSREVWRAFLWAETGTGTGTDPWGVNRLMESISLSESHTAFSVLSMITGP